MTLDEFLVELSREAARVPFTTTRFGFRQQDTGFCPLVAVANRQGGAFCNLDFQAAANHLGLSWVEGLALVNASDAYYSPDHRDLYFRLVAAAEEGFVCAEKARS